MKTRLSCVMPLRLHASEAVTFLHYTVVDEAGFKVGIIQSASHRISDAKVWEWYINGEIVAQPVTANGSARSLNQAKTALAKNWRRWLKLNGLPEDHRPMFG